MKSDLDDWWQNSASLVGCAWKKTQSQSQVCEHFFIVTGLKQHLMVIQFSFRCLASVTPCLWSKLGYNQPIHIDENSNIFVNIKHFFLVLVCLLFSGT